MLTRISREDYYGKYFKENKKKNAKRIRSAIRIIAHHRRTSKYQPSSLVTENKTTLNLNMISNNFNKALHNLKAK